MDEPKISSRYIRLIRRCNEEGSPTRVGKLFQPQKQLQSPKLLQFAPHETPTVPIFIADNINPKEVLSPECCINGPHAFRGGPEPQICFDDCQGSNFSIYAVESSAVSTQPLLDVEQQLSSDPFSTDEDENMEKIQLVKPRSINQRQLLQQKKPPHLIAKRNARERKRVQAVNTAFSRLRKILPYAQGRSKRISKVRTLQEAINYIDHLQQLLREDQFGTENDNLKQRHIPSEITERETLPVEIEEDSLKAYKKGPLDKRLVCENHRNNCEDQGSVKVETDAESRTPRHPSSSESPLDESSVVNAQRPDSSGYERPGENLSSFFNYSSFSNFLT